MPIKLTSKNKPAFPINKSLTQNELNKKAPETVPELVFNYLIEF